MLLSELVGQIAEKNGVDVDALPNKLLSTQMCAILKKLGGGPGRPS